MNKSKLLFVSLMLAFGVSVAHATAAARTAKDYATLKFTANFTTATQAVTFGQTAPAVLYEVVMSSGAPGGDFIALYDTNACQGFAVGANTNLAIRFVNSSTNTIIWQLDPPMQFNTGMCIVPGSANLLGTIIYEPGRNVGAQ